MGVDAVITVSNHNLKELEVRKLSSALTSRIGKENFWMDRAKDQHALSINEDGDIIVNTFMRYYGPGYERGDWLIIRGICEFLEHSIPFGQVRYGGDSSDHHPLFSSIKNENNNHWLKYGYEPYRGYTLHKDNPDIECGFCKKVYHDIGGGGGATFLHCDGCGDKIVLDREGIIHNIAEGKDFFGWQNA